MDIQQRRKEAMTQQQQQRRQQLKRRRRTQACEYCHMKKVKCEGDGVRCLNCMRNDVQCVWGQKRKRGPKPKSGLALVMRTQKLQQYQQQPPPGEERTDDDVDVEGGQKLPVVARKLSPAEGIRVPQLDQDMRDFFSDKVDGETREAVRFYFDYFYPLSPMFHPSMFIRRLVHGQVDPLLIDTIKATTARVITQKTGRVVDGKALAESVKARMLGQLENPTVDLVRTIVAMTLHAGSIGEHVSYNSLICLAASLVVRLGWHQLDLYRRPAPGSWDEWVSLEVKRRLFWLVYQIDSYQALLTGRPMSVAEDSVYVSAPCSDYEWDAMHINRRTIPGKGNESLSRSSSAQAQPQRSSRSSSGSGTSLPSLRVSANEIVATGAFSYSFMALCELTAILAQINSFLRDAKASRPSLLVTPLGSNGSAPFPAVDFMTAAGTSGNTGSLVYPILRTVSVLSEYPAFAEIDERLQEWHRSLLMPEDLRDDATEAGDISYFGTADHRRFMMRVRYFCLHCYYTPIAIFLHQSNRRSFFTEYEQPLEERLAKTRTKATNSPQAGQVPTEASMTSEDISAMESDRQLREMLNMAFASTWNEGLLAYDIEESSWKVCVQSSKDLSEHLRRNDDFPLDRFDQVIPFCIFMSVSVLIRQVRMCSRILSEQEEQKLEVMGGRAAVMAERAHCVEYIKHQWTTLQALSALWDVDGLEQLLKSMQLDEVTKAADMFSTMLL
ncbi:hypothetical protein GGF46_004726 [Coemansia sp. RSA 552]|nr:hypothetical protein GGF46_004726 [Coemansia sp. RSA 552]